MLTNLGVIVNYVPILYTKPLFWNRIYCANKCTYVAYAKCQGQSWGDLV